MLSIAILIFLIVYVFIVFDKYHRTIVALLGAIIMLIFGVFQETPEITAQSKALSYVDFNTIGLLIGMMIIVFILRQTKLFQYLAIKSVKLAKGCPWKVLVYLTITTFVLSSFLDNVTTVMLIAPVTIAIASGFGISPYPYLISQIFAANLGGAATLIGDPSTILIGSTARIVGENGELTRMSFMYFLSNMGPITLIACVVCLLMIRMFYAKELKVPDHAKENALNTSTEGIIKNKWLLIKCCAVLLMVFTGFVTSSSTHIDLATIALGGAALLLLLTHNDDEIHLEESLEKVEWTEIFFFLGMFIVVGGLEEVGAITAIANHVSDFTGGNLMKETFVILWVSTFVSAFINNIPFVVTMIPIVQTLGEINPDHLNILWWALTVGVCFGGNATIVGASANLVVSGIASRSGYKISFLRFFKVGFPIAMVTVIVGSIYIWIRYLI